MRALLFLATVAFSIPALFTDEAVAANFSYDLPDIPVPPGMRPQPTGGGKDQDSKNPKDSSKTVSPPTKKLGRDCGSKVPASYQCRRSVFLGQTRMEREDELADHIDVMTGTWQLITAVTMDGQVNPQPMPIGEIVWGEKDITASNGVLKAQAGDDGQAYRMSKASPENTIEVYFLDPADSRTKGVQCRLFLAPTEELVCKWYEQNDRGEGFAQKGYITYMRNAPDAAPDPQASPERQEPEQ